MNQSVYIHIDTTSNVVMTRGIQSKDFNTGITHLPTNLLLLNPASEYGDYESHTGLKVIRGSEGVNTYTQLVSKGRINEENKWIDFADIGMLRELTALEISELLYFGHMRNHLHSPFFYKLQNNFVYFDLPNSISRVYYRYLDEFYHILAGKIRLITLEKLNEKKYFFKRPTSVDRLPIEMLRSLLDVMKEGIILSFDRAYHEDKNYSIPIYYAEQELSNKVTTSDELYVGKLTYQLNKRRWILDLEEENLLFLHV